MVTAMRSRGFTLTEALVVIFIIGVLAAIAFPAMTTFLTTQAVRSTAYDLFADLIYARSEAISRGTTVSIISTGDWMDGWVIQDNSAPAPPLRTQAARDSAILIKDSADKITFDRTGRANAAEVTFSIYPKAASTQDYQKRCIRLDPSGRPKSAEGVCP